MAYTRRGTITVDHTLCGPADSVDYPVLVKLNNAAFKTVANGGYVQDANGYDITFCSDAAGTIPLTWCPYSYDAVNGVWYGRVKLSLSHTVDTTFYVFFANSSISTLQTTPTSTFDSNYQLFLNMAQDPSGSAPQITDLTVNARHGTTSGGMSSGQLGTGKVSSAIHFDGSDDAVGFGTTFLPTHAGPYTGSLWVNGEGVADTAAHAGGLIGICRQSTEAYNFLFDWGHYDEAGDQTLGFNSNLSGSYPDVRTTTAVSPTGWQHVGFTFDGSNVQFYINGVLDSAPAWSAGNIPDNTDSGGTQTLKVGGRRPGVSTNVFGTLDEVKFSNTKRSASWFAIEYNNENAPETFAALIGITDYATTWTGASDSNWGYPADAASGNFTDGFVPSSLVDVVVNGTPGTNITMPDFSAGDVAVKSLDFTGFNAALIGNVTCHASVVNNLTYSAGMSFTCKLEMTHTGVGTLTTNGVQVPSVLLTGAITADVTLADNLNTNYFYFTGNDADMRQGTKSITVAPMTFYDGLQGGTFKHTSNASIWSWSTGATVTIDAGSTGSPTTNIIGPAGGVDGTITVPPTTITGTKPITYHARMKFQSVNMSAYTGTMTMDVSSGMIRTVGDLTIGACTFNITAATRFIVGGNFLCAGNLNGGTGLTATVTGTARAIGGASKTITNCNFGGGSKLYAPGCIDGGGNTNVDFTVYGSNKPFGPWGFFGAFGFSF